MSSHPEQSEAVILSEAKDLPSFTGCQNGRVGLSLAMLAQDDNTPVTRTACQS